MHLYTQRSVVSIGLLAAVMVASVTLADDSTATHTPAETPTTGLVLHPAAEPTPALKYQLLPTLMDRRPGNAALVYYKLLPDLELAERALGDEGVDWLTVPLDGAMVETARELVSNFGHNVLEPIKRASRMNHCDWQLPLGEQDSYSIPLPELQAMRAAGRLLALEARVEIADGDLDEALATLRVGYVLAKHVGEEPTLVSHMVGITISEMMSGCLVDLIQQPGAPNLYWALTCMGDGWMDARGGMELERFALDLTYSWWDDLYSNEVAAAVWRNRFDQLFRDIGSWSDEPEFDLPLTGPTLLGIQGYPRAKQFLLDQGHPASDVEAMPVAQVLLIYTIETFRDLHDDIYKWGYLPYWQVRRQMSDAANQMDEASRDREIIPLARALAAGIESFHVYRARHDRTFAALRVVEAIRLYGASHGGQLPEQLNDITDYPLPIDPTTGTAFRYHKVGRTAVLQSPSPVVAAPDRGLRYEIKFAQ